jgi:hypothetical protein
MLGEGEHVAARCRTEVRDGPVGARMAIRRASRALGRLGARRPPEHGVASAQAGAGNGSLGPSASSSWAPEAVRRPAWSVSAFSRSRQRRPRWHLRPANKIPLSNRAMSGASRPTATSSAISPMRVSDAMRGRALSVANLAHARVVGRSGVATVDWPALLCRDCETHVSQRNATAVGS